MIEMKATAYVTFRFADAQERWASKPSENEMGSLAIQEDTNDMYMLSSVFPLIWMKICGVSTSSDQEARFVCIEDHEEDNHEGMIQNPITKEWSWL